MMKQLGSAFLALASLTFFSASVGSADLIQSAPHHIECWGSPAGSTRSYDNDVRGPFYATGNFVIFLDKATGLMTRIAATPCSITWSQKDAY